MRRLSLAADRKDWAETARAVLDPAEQVNVIGCAEDLAEAVQALLAEREHLAGQLRDVRAKNRELRRGPRIVGEPEVFVVPHDGAAAYVFADFDDALRYAQAKGEGWEPDDAEILGRESTEKLIAQEEAKRCA